jgi:hypothetical protein
MVPASSVRRCFTMTLSQLKAALGFHSEAQHIRTYFRDLCTGSIF